MLTRRDVLKLLPLSLLARPSQAAEAEEFERIDSHIHIHRDAPAVFSSLKTSKWSGLDLVVCPTEKSEPYDLESRLDSTLKGSKASGGRLAWASTFDARGFEEPEFTERVIARLRKSFDDGAIGVKIWKNIGMAIRGKSGAYLLPDDPSLLPIYEAIQKAGKTLIAHLAEPDGAWMPLDDKNPEFPYYSKNPQWHMLGKGTPSKESILAARDHILAKFPKLRVVGCHLGSDEDNLDRLAKRLDKFPNFAVDTAARTRYFARGDRDRAIAFITKYQDQLLYATDYSLRQADPEAGAKSLLQRHNDDIAFYAGSSKMEYEGKPTRGLGLPATVLGKLFRENARRWLPGIGV